MKTMKWAILGLIIIALGVWLSGCTRKNKGQIMDGDGTATGRSRRKKRKR